MGGDERRCRRIGKGADRRLYSGRGGPSKERLLHSRKQKTFDASSDETEGQITPKVLGDVPPQGNPGKGNGTEGTEMEISKISLEAQIECPDA